MVETMMTDDEVEAVAIAVVLVIAVAAEADAAPVEIHETDPAAKVPPVARCAVESLVGEIPVAVMITEALALERAAAAAVGVERSEEPPVVMMITGVLALEEVEVERTEMTTGVISLEKAIAVEVKGAKKAKDVLVVSLGVETRGELKMIKIPSPARFRSRIMV